LGELEHAIFKEGVILEIVGQKGVFRINLQEHEIKKNQSSNDIVRSQRITKI
jgi:hypothetical protein